MKKADTPSIYKWNIYIFAILFTIASFLWIFFVNRYHVIGFQEETQLFRTDSQYIQSYLNRPGGLIDYLGAFFIQFYYYKWLGALIIPLFISLIFLFLVKICREDNNIIERLFLFPAIIPALLLIMSNDMYFYLSYILGVGFALVCMIIYQSIPKRKMKYVIGVLLYFVTYFVAGGNAFIFIALVIINELFNKERSLLYIGGMIALSVIVPYLAYLFIYITRLENAYLAFSPFTLGFPSKVYTIAWLSVPVIYFMSELLKKKKWLQNTKSLKVIIPSYIVIIAGLFYGLKSTDEPNLEYLFRLEHEAEQGNWGKILEMRIARPQLDKGNALATFYTNIALSEMGALSSLMFQFTQTGGVGFFLDWIPTHFSPWHSGEQYYRLGIIPEAEHCAYEEMVNNIRGEYGSKTLRRLVNTTMLRGDEKGFEKYIKLFEKSPIYKNWAKQQRENYEKISNDSTFHIPNLPERLHYRDFFMNYARPENHFVFILEDNPQNKKIFENLMAYFLLIKQAGSFVTFLDKYYANMGYDEMPRHFEEALLICKYSGMKNMEDILERYPVSEEITEEFMEYTRIAKNTTSQADIDKLKEQFGDTYWYYYLYVNHQLLREFEGQDRYR
ncbi:MAG: DUF6057 family protein [Prevotella sp.]|jgi:hypothetical protein|nr:DUF6057 family protein [Prevotella sp.]